MVKYEYSFVKNIPIKELFLLMIENGEDNSGWVFQYEKSTYSMQWHPTFMRNIWVRYPKVFAVLHSISETKTLCTIETIDLIGKAPSKNFKKVHDKAFDQLFKKTNAMK